MIPGVSNYIVVEFDFEVFSHILNVGSGQYMMLKMKVDTYPSLQSFARLRISREIPGAALTAY